MKFFLDTANLGKIKLALEWGLLDGVTTNPTLISREKGVDYRQRLQEICEIVPGPVSAEGVGETCAEMLEEARRFRQIGENIVVKLPCTREGLRALKVLADEGTPTNMTLCFQEPQALAAAKLGATYLSTFVGRLDTIMTPGVELIGRIRRIYDNYGFTTKLVAASIRSPLHVVQAAALGADVVTIPPDTFNDMLKHPLTDAGVLQFQADWRKSQQAEQTA